MFERLLDQVGGYMVAGAHARARNRLPALVEELVEDAVTLWSANGWSRFDDLEVNCSVQFYRWLREARRAHIQFVPLSIELESVILTPGMLDGTESVKTASRPDLRITAGSGAIIVEAKRLKAQKGWCKKYVDEGMARFVTATYAASETRALMVGYVQQGATEDIAATVNDHVDVHPQMGVAHRVTHHFDRGPASWLGSSHQRRSSPVLILRHLWITLP